MSEGTIHIDPGGNSANAALHQQPEEYIEQVVEDLVLFVARGIADPTQYKIKIQRKAKFKLFAVTASIIGESHVINVRHPLIDMSEVLACVDLCEAPELKTSGKLVNLKSPMSTKFGVASHTISWTIDTLEVLDPTIDDICTQAQNADGQTSLGLVEDFSAPEDTTRMPRTILYVEMIDDTLIFKTVHEYLPQGKAAVTCTTLKLLKLED